MTKNLRPIGNSLGLIIDKPILELLKIDQNTPLNIQTDGESLIIRPIREPSSESTSSRSSRLQASMDRVADLHADAFEKLAK